uniref:RPGR-interacting protein 1 first C2 domain-containing protein n=1 Tax=Guillardia theta TaxID=55529 RepID=A0A7S4N364_GUITH
MMKEKENLVSSLEEVKQKGKEVAAKVTILESRQERTIAAFKDEQDKHDKMVEELEELKSQLREQQDAVQLLWREKNLLELQVSDAGAMEKGLEEVRREVAKLEEENEQLRSRAFNAGSVKVTVRMKAGTFRALSEENARLKQQTEELEEQVKREETKVLEVMSGEENGIGQLRQSVERGKERMRKLKEESDELRKRLSEFVGQKHSEYMAEEARAMAEKMASSFEEELEEGGAHAANKIRRQIRRLRRENAVEVRELLKLKQELHMHELLLREAKQLEEETEAYVKHSSHLHSRKLRRLQRQLARVEVENDRRRRRLEEEAGGGGGGGSVEGRRELPPAVVASDALGSQSIRGVVEIIVDNLQLDKSYKSFAYFEPRTLLLLDFFIHDTQHSDIWVGLQPPNQMRKRLEVVLDSLFCHYLYTEHICIQLLQVVGLDSHPLAQAKLSLRGFVDSPGTERLDFHQVALLEPQSDRIIGKINVSVSVHPDMKHAARTFLATMAEEEEEVKEEVKVLEDMARRVACSYDLCVRLDKLTGCPPDRQFSLMYQVLDFDVYQSAPLRVDSSGSLPLGPIISSYSIPTEEHIDRQLLSRKLDFFLFTAEDSSEELHASGSVLLAPLVSRRGFTAKLSLLSPAGARAAELSLEVSWRPEPVKLQEGGDSPVKVLEQALKWMEEIETITRENASEVAFRRLLVAASSKEETLSRAAFAHALRSQCPGAVKFSDSALSGFFEMASNKSDAVSLASFSAVVHRDVPRGVGQHTISMAQEIEDDVPEEYEEAFESEVIHPTSSNLV